MPRGLFKWEHRWRETLAHRSVCILSIRPTRVNSAKHMFLKWHPNQKVRTHNFRRPLGKFSSNEKFVWSWADLNSALPRVRQAQYHNSAVACDHIHLLLINRILLLISERKLFEKNLYYANSVMMSRESESLLASGFSIYDYHSNLKTLDMLNRSIENARKVTIENFKGKLPSKIILNISQTKVLYSYINDE